jgi:hypothetical protein
MGAMKCTKCGNALTDDALFCGQCGAVVGASYAKPEHGVGFSAPPPVPAIVHADIAASASAPASAAPRGSRSETGLLTRANAIVLRPRTEWPVIAEEPATPFEVYLNYVVPLAAIGAIALMIGQVFIGTPIPIVGIVRAGLGEAVIASLVLFGLTLASVYALARLVDSLAPKFGGERDALRALKLVAYSYTPAWLAGVIYLLPALSGLSLFASIYGLYLLYLGLPVLMRVPKDQTVGLTIAMVVGAAVLSLVVGALTSCVAGFGPLMFG